MAACREGKQEGNDYIQCLMYTWRQNHQTAGPMWHLRVPKQAAWQVAPVTWARSQAERAALAFGLACWGSATASQSLRFLDTGSKAADGAGGSARKGTTAQSNIQQVTYKPLAAHPCLHASSYGTTLTKTFSSAVPNSCVDVELQHAMVRWK